MDNEINILTRDSFLALAQSITIAGKYIAQGKTVNIIAQKTAGDIQLNEPLYKIGKEDSQYQDKEGKAFFTKELEDGLLNKTGDIAVHSLKDLPTELPPGLSLAVVDLPEDSTDTIVSPNKLPEDFDEQIKQIGKMKIGTSSLRRIALMRQWYPGSEIIPLRGNLVTRLEKLIYKKETDILILATAGVKRLFQFYDTWTKNRNTWENKLPKALISKLDSQHKRLAKLKQENLFLYKLNANSFLPAVSQGVLGIESREEDVSSVGKLHDPEEKLNERIYLERKMLSHLEAGCHIPFGTNVINTGQYFNCSVFFAPGFDPNEQYKGKVYRGQRNIQYNTKNDNNITTLIDEIKGKNFPIIYCGVKHLPFEKKLNEYACDFSHLPLIQTVAENIDNSILEKQFDVGVVVSKSAVQYLPVKQPNVKSWVAIGNKTAEKLKLKYPDHDISTPDIFNGEEAARLILDKKDAKSVLWIGAKDGMKNGLKMVSEAGFDVTFLGNYSTKSQPALQSINLGNKNFTLETLLNEKLWWVFTAPSMVRSYFEQDLHRSNHLISVIGGTTEKVFLEKGIIPFHKASVSDMEILAAEITGNQKNAKWQTEQWSI